MNEEMLKLIKKGIENYHNSIIAINIKDIKDYLSIINSQLKIDNNYSIEFKLENLVLSYCIISIEKGCIHCESIGTFEPSQQFYPIKFLVSNSNMILSFSDNNSLYKYFYNIIETPKFGMIFCKYFPDVVKKLNEKP